MNKLTNETQAGTMKPGRELDALVAEKVMHKKHPFYPKEEGMTFWEDAARRAVNKVCLNDVPRYSTDIAAAWDVVMRLERTLDQTCWTGEFGLSCDGVWQASWSFWRPKKGKWAVTADSYVSAPHAICLAALKAVDAANDEN